MTEGTTAPVSSVQNVTATTPKKQKKSTKGKSTHAASHPKYSDMIKAALKALNERGGSSRAAILKYVLAHYSLDPIQANQHLKSALKNGVKSKNFKQTKGNGASGSFKLADAAKKPAKKRSTKPKKSSSTAASGTKKRARSKSAGTKSAKKVATAGTNNSATTAATPAAATTASTTTAAAKPKKVKIAKGSKKAAKPKAAGATKTKKPTQTKAKKSHWN